MKKDLIIVESPNKIKSIQSYLGDNYNVIATGGHLRELDKRRGIDPQTYDLNWKTIQTKGKFSKQKLITEIKDLAKNSNKIYLATDPDREGEAISWHVYDLLAKNEKERSKRITFNEITKKAILKSIDEQRDIDYKLVGSQFARRVFDRLIGYKLSSLVQRNLKGISAGRVQSIALLFVVERELERRAFVKEEWYQVEGIIGNDIEVFLKEIPYEVPLYNKKENNDENIKFLNRVDAEYVVNNLSNEFKAYQVDDIKVTKGDSVKPLTTDKLLQMASNSYGWSANKTTSVAQEMFEGLEINKEQIALITYPRTDSERLSDDFLNDAYDFISNKYGVDQLVKQNEDNLNKNAKNIQDAHEAIRPVDINLLPEEIKEHVSSDIYKLYNLVWSRTVASLMLPPTFNRQTIRFENNNYKFVALYKTIKTLGYWVLSFYEKNAKMFEINPPSVKVGDVFNKKEINVLDKETLPPPYYTEATLISALKNAGVGRPSTYASMATIGTKRGYINKESGKLIPTEHGIRVILELKKAFPNVISIVFTSNMENDLDKIATGLILDWKEPIKDFVPTFEENLKEAYKIIEKVQDEKTGNLCPQCNSELLFKRSKSNATFIACSNFPTCRYTESIEKPEILEEKCPQCANNLIKRKNKRNKWFIGCTNWPNCNFIKNIPTEKENKNKDNINQDETE